MAKQVAIVVVSHSDLIARGVVEVAAQMAPDVVLFAAGGTAEGGIGTSFDAVEEAVSAALQTDGVKSVVLTADLGSAVMTAESVVDFADEDVRLADGALVEGTVAGAVQAQMDRDAEAVAVAVQIAVSSDLPLGAPGAAATAGDPEPAKAAEQVSRDVVINDEHGLHARPAAEVARIAAGFDAKVALNGADATSILALMGLGTVKGDTITVAATGVQAWEAMEAVAEAIAALR